MAFIWDIWNWLFTPTSEYNSKLRSDDFIHVSPFSSGRNSPNRNSALLVEFETQQIPLEPNDLSHLTVEEIDKEEELTPPSLVEETEKQPKKLLRVASAITLVVAVIFFIFLLMYSTGAFHFETFIGPIGPGISFTLCSFLVVLSGVTLISSYRR